MKKSRFGFLLFDQFEDLDFFGPWEMLAIWSQQFNGPKNLILVSESNGFATSAKGLCIKTQTDFSECPPLDYLLIPGGMGTRTEVNNKKLIAFIKQQANSCQHILSVCTGAFLLQAAGLLKNKRATTHWHSLDRLRAFSDITVIEKERFVKDDNIWTSAGVSAGIDLSLAFIAYISGDKVAGDVQHFAEYYPNKKIYTKEKTLPQYTNSTT